MIFYGDSLWREGTVFKYILYSIIYTYISYTHTHTHTHTHTQILWREGTEAA
jgi:hypothetical protein